MGVFIISEKATGQKYKLEFLDSTFSYWASKYPYGNVQQDLENRTI